jgi:hypothetical protein
MEFIDFHLIGKTDLMSEKFLGEKPKTAKSESSEDACAMKTLWTLMFSSEKEGMGGTTSAASKLVGV